MNNSSPTSRFLDFCNLIARLRRECPWDKEQTHISLRTALVEETYEVLEAIDSGDDAELRQELGDLLLQVIFHSTLAAERNAFSIDDVIATISEKLIRRHPHIFGEKKVSSAEEVRDHWEVLKRKQEGRQSALDGVPKILPSLQRAHRLQDKASRTGFDWEKKTDVWKKVKEELEEFEKETSPKRREEEFGDLLFSLVNYARFENIDSENALRVTNEKFIQRFTFIEESLRERGKSIDDASLEEMDELWNKAKTLGKT